MLKSRTDDRPDVTTLGGYHLLRRLDAGGTAEVYIAERHSLGDQPVAVKVVRIDGGSPSTTPAEARAGEAARFLREAHVLARFTHPNILPVYEAGIENGHLYLAMQYVAGGSLADAIRGHSRHPMRLPAMLPLVIELVDQLASALQYIHDRGVVHGALRPTNVLVEFGPEAHPHLLLADFGIARDFAPIIAGARAAGTVAYMAPEQFGGRALPASDQYALAVLAYQLLTKRTPFQGAAAAQTFGHLYGKPPPAHAHNRTLPREVSEVLSRALAKDPRARFPSVAAFAEALRDAMHEPETALLVGDDIVDAQPETPTAALVTRPDGMPAPGVALASREGRLRVARRENWWKPVALIAVVALLAFALVADASVFQQHLSRGFRSPAATATPPATATAGPAVTATPTPSQSPAAGDAASVAQLVAPASVVPGQQFTALITFANNGTTTWTDGAGYRLVCDTMHHPRQNCPSRLNVTLAGMTITPGHTMRFALTLVAPREPGTYQTWVNLSRNGALFPTPDALLTVTVAPAAPVATPIPPPVATPSTPPTATPRPSPTPTTAPAPTPTPSTTPAPTPTAAPTPTPSPPAPTPTAAPSPTPSPPTATPTTAPAPTPTLEPTPSPPPIQM